MSQKNEKNVISMVPDNLKKVFSNKLLEILFSTNNMHKIPVSIRRQTFNLMNLDRIVSDYGLELLLQQAMMVEPEQTLEVLADTLSLDLVMTEIKDLKSKLNKKFKLIYSTE
ncbi:MAG: hypothetical protein GF329_19780 [Candidatus Lokiarchaeota archaeon]|nr:hypothetical protein [Candidatus Lokiarchaeota archaeon]